MDSDTQAQGSTPPSGFRGNADDNSAGAAVGRYKGLALVAAVLMLAVLVAVISAVTLWPE